MCHPPADFFASELAVRPILREVVRSGCCCTESCVILDIQWLLIEHLRGRSSHPWCTHGVRTIEPVFLEQTLCLPRIGLQLDPFFRPTDDAVQDSGFLRVTVSRSKARAHFELVVLR